jgi:multisubunit Na+/H+ antiporter MnhG subunit
MSAHGLILDVLLSLVVLSCWMGAFGMVRMRTPLQSLQYVTLTIGAAMVLLAAAVLFDVGVNSNTVKVGLMAAVMLAINPVVTHASARAFRVRQLGHWEPRDGDPIEFVPSSHHPAEPKNSPGVRP